MMEGGWYDGRGGYDGNRGYDGKGYDRSGGGGYDGSESMIEGGVRWKSDVGGVMMEGGEYDGSGGHDRRECTMEVGGMMEGGMMEGGEV